jgi:muramoyltetrapeptide carboxypeptidase LdcA involved in peptidoglycan recycling
MDYVKPGRLRRGDTVAVLTTSYGGPQAFPAIFELGLAALVDTFGLVVKEYPTTRLSPAELAADPRRRARDFNAAFADPEVAAVLCAIGGNDSALILPHLDPATIRDNPKILLGFSDNLTQLVFAHLLGLVTFNGPSVMVGFAQLPSFPAAAVHITSILFEPTGSYAYAPYAEWSENDWRQTGPDGSSGPRRPHDGWHWLNGSGVRSGRLFGGCIEVLQVLNGSRWWPDQGFWRDRVLFVETSEGKPTLGQVRDWLFNFGVQGVYGQVAALLVGRARGYSDSEKDDLDRMIVDTVVGQFGATDLTIVTNMDFGHTDPQWILPLGINAEVDHTKRSFRLLEPAVR